MLDKQLAFFVYYPEIFVCLEWSVASCNLQKRGLLFGQLARKSVYALSIQSDDIGVEEGGLRKSLFEREYYESYIQIYKRSW